MNTLLGIFDTKEKNIKVYITDYDFCKGETLYILESITNELNIKEIKYGTKLQMAYIVKDYVPINIKEYNLLLGRLL